MKRFIIDTILCSAFIFSLMGLFASFTLFKVFDVFDPIGDMFSDFEMSDLVMSKLRVPPSASEDILVVNIADANREEIAQMIQIIEQFHPAVIGVDVTFNTKKSYKEDSLLALVLSENDNIVIGSELRLPNPKTGIFDTLILPVPLLAEHADFGFVNLLTNARDQDDVKFCRNFVTSQKVKGLDSLQYSFAVQLALYKDLERTHKFLDRGNTIETINYKGNVIGSQSELGTRYFVLDYYQVFDFAFTEDLIQDKVVIMCYMGAYLGDQTTRNDLYFTPLNANYVGKAEPDMFGGVIHANTVSMILEEDFIDSMSKSTAIILAILVCFFNVFFFKLVYGALPKWYDGITKLMQLFQVILVSILMIWLFNQFNFKADLTLALIVIALSGDSIEVYHGVIKNLFSRKERASIFKMNKDFLKEG
ncbi:MAG: CHASE2 domain-containing sensor protein [Cyclobacteriaceae bacterium]|jgi:CHASE2 domain-containing sensor protein